MALRPEKITHPLRQLTDVGLGDFLRPRVTAAT